MPGHAARLADPFADEAHRLGQVLGTDDDQGHHDDEQQLGGRDVEHASASPPRTDIGQRRSVSAVGVGDGAASGVRCPSICRGAGAAASSSALPFLELLMPLATSTVIADKRPCPHSKQLGKAQGGEEECKNEALTRCSLNKK